MWLSVAKMPQNLRFTCKYMWTRKTSDSSPKGHQTWRKKRRVLRTMFRNIFFCAAARRWPKNNIRGFRRNPKITRNWNFGHLVNSHFWLGTDSFHCIFEIWHQSTYQKWVIHIPKWVIHIYVTFCCKDASKLQVQIPKEWRQRHRREWRQRRRRIDTERRKTS